MTRKKARKCGLKKKAHPKNTRVKPNVNSDEAPSVLKAEYEQESRITRGFGDPSWQKYRDGD